MNTVTIDLGEYNYLRDFEKEIKKGNVYTVRRNGWKITEGFYKKDDFIESLTNSINEANEKIKTQDALIQDQLNKICELEKRKDCLFRRLFTYLSRS